jgi:hypothetical protein
MTAKPRKPLLPDEVWIALALIFLALVTFALFFPAISAQMR